MLTHSEADVGILSSHVTQQIWAFSRAHLSHARIIMSEHLRTLRVWSLTLRPYVPASRFNNRYYPKQVASVSLLISDESLPCQVSFPLVSH
jgi:hypothetical protein